MQRRIRGMLPLKHPLSQSAAERRVHSTKQSEHWKKPGSSVIWGESRKWVGRIERSISPWSDLLPFCVVTHHMEKSSDSNRRREKLWNETLYHGYTAPFWTSAVVYSVACKPWIRPQKSCSRWGRLVVVFFPPSTACFFFLFSSLVPSGRQHIYFSCRLTFQRSRVVPGQKNYSAAAQMETLSTWS